MHGPPEDDREFVTLVARTLEFEANTTFINPGLPGKEYYVPHAFFRYQDPEEFLDKEVPFNFSVTFDFLLLEQERVGGSFGRLTGGIAASPTRRVPGLIEWRRLLKDGHARFNW